MCECYLFLIAYMGNLPECWFMRGCWFMRWGGEGVCAIFRISLTKNRYLLRHRDHRTLPIQGLHTLSLSYLVYSGTSDNDGHSEEWTPPYNGQTVHTPCLHTFLPQKNGKPLKKLTYVTTSEEGTVTMDKMLVPNVSIIQRFHY